MTETSPRLPLPKVLAFAGVGLPLAAVGLPVAVFLVPFYASEMGLGVTITGLVFMCLRFWDLGTDLVMGYAVDRFPTRYGRVKHWLLLSVPVLGLAAYFLYMPGRGDVAWPYLAFWLAIFWMGFTLLQTPHQSWAPAIAKTYDDRSRLFMWREIVSTAALLFLLLLPDLLGHFAGYDTHQQIQTMGLILIISLPLMVGLSVLIVPDPLLADGKKTDISRAAIADALKNPLLWRIGLAEIAIGVAIASTAATYLFFAKWSLGIEEGASTALFVFFVAGFFALPFWLWFARRTEKHIALRTIALFCAVAYSLFVPFSWIGGLGALMVSSAIAGLGFGAPFVLVRAMMADLIERELARTGEDRSGLYYSVLSSTYKTGASLAVGVPYLILGLIIGFVPEGPNSPAVISGLTATFIGVPVVAYLLVAIIIWRYPLTRAEQAKTAEMLAARAKAV